MSDVKQDSMENRFRQKLTGTDDFVVSVELVPSRGLMRKQFEDLISFTEAALAHGGVDALSLTDNPGGNPRLAPDVLGLDILYRGMSPLVHLTCKDQNRNSLESRAFQLNRMGVQNVLALTGDYPVDGYRGVARPSFDLDAVSLVRMLDDMNRGLRVEVRPGKFQDLEPTDFLIGASVSPFKKQREELLGQYIKLEKKIAAGAHYIITQLGYDMRKFDELLRYMRDKGLDVPVIGYVYVPHRIVSRVMNQDQVPGCVVTDEMLEWVNRQAASDDKGKAAFLEFSAKLVAALKGLGYRGAHIGGFMLKFEDIAGVIDMASQMESQWREFAREIGFSQPDEFFYYDRDEETGLSSAEKSAGDGAVKDPGVAYGLMKILHEGFFEPGTGGFRLARGMCSCVDRSELARKTFARLEHGIKLLTNNCKACGDCALAELAYLCPEGECAKGLRNGPCGGSADGVCERQDRDCFWTRVIGRLESDGRLREFAEREVLQPDSDLRDTSSWLNYYLGRDHTGKGEEEPEEKQEK